MRSVDGLGFWFGMPSSSVLAWKFFEIERATVFYAAWSLTRTLNIGRKCLNLYAGFLFCNPKQPLLCRIWPQKFLFLKKRKKKAWVLCFVVYLVGATLCINVNYLLPDLFPAVIFVFPCLFFFLCMLSHVAWSFLAILMHVGNVCHPWWWLLDKSYGTFDTVSSCSIKYMHFYFVWDIV